MAELPGRPMPSGFDYRPIDDFPALRFTADEYIEWQAWLREVKRTRLRAMQSANTHVLGKGDSDGW